MSNVYDFEVMGSETAVTVKYKVNVGTGTPQLGLATVDRIADVSLWGTGMLVLHQLGVAWFSLPWPHASRPAPEACRVVDEIKALEKDCPAIKAALDEIEFRKALDTAALHKLQYSMEERLACKRLEGRKGWEDAPEQVLRDLFYDAVARDSLIGAANYLAFMHQRGISLLPAPPQKVKLQVEVDTAQATAKIKELRDAVYGVLGLADGGQPMQARVEDDDVGKVGVTVNNAARRLEEIKEDVLQLGAAYADLARISRNK